MPLNIQEHLLQFLLVLSITIFISFCRFLERLKNVKNISSVKLT